MPRKTTKRSDEAAPAEVLDLKAAADFLKVSKPTFYRWLAQGKIKGHKAGTQWRFYQADLEKFLHTEEPSALQVDADALRQSVQTARKTRGLKPIEWPDSETPEESTVIGIVNTIIGDAIESSASDIHVDTTADDTLIRYRIDGVLNEVMRLPRTAARALVSRLKLMADMDVSERRLPDNGRISIQLQGRDYDIRVTTVPAVFGESAICRLLDPGSILIGLDRLGLSPAMRQAFEHKLHAPSGLIIVTGPAGAGRTTTVYSSLNLIISPHVKTCTIEDPVEYRLPNTMQVHVNRKMGLTFATGLRTFMRADPDIIMVGDLRDLETAEGCINAAMTGHLVLTCMLPGDATSVITRLAEMGLEPFLIGASLNAVLAQRLVRRVCQHCKTDYQPSPELLARLGRATGLDLSTGHFVRGAGCPECHQTGYRSRIALFELLDINDRLRALIATPSTTEELRAAAIESGMTTLLKDGVEKARQGITTLEEVLRILAVHYKEIFEVNS